MTPALLYQRILWRSVALVYQGIIRSLLRNGHASGVDWESFQHDLARWMFWIDLSAAASLRYRGTREITIIPPLGEHETTPRLPEVAHLNPWYVEHRLQSNPLIEARAAWIRTVEESHLTRKAQTLVRLATSPETKDRFNPLWRLERERREAYGTISNTSQQIQLAQPVIGDLFPMAMYLSRDDARVRPTHAAMHRFIALRSWRGWPICVPPCSWNCRCFTRFYSRFECIEKGWMTKDGYPRFEHRFPNTLAEKNWKNGLFPEWKTPRAWAFPGEKLMKVA